MRWGGRYSYPYRIVLGLLFEAARGTLVPPGTSPRSPALHGPPQTLCPGGGQGNKCQLGGKRYGPRGPKKELRRKAATPVGNRLPKDSHPFKVGNPGGKKRRKLGADRRMSWEIRGPAGGAGKDSGVNIHTQVPVRASWRIFISHRQG